MDRCAAVGSRSGGGLGWADAPMTAPKPRIDCDTVSDGRRGRVRAGGGERGSADSTGSSTAAASRAGVTFCRGVARLAAPRQVAGSAGTCTPGLLLPGGGACCCPLGTPRFRAVPRVLRRQPRPAAPRPSPSLHFLTHWTWTNPITIVPCHVSFEVTTITQPRRRTARRGDGRPGSGWSSRARMVLEGR